MFLETVANPSFIAKYNDAKHLSYLLRDLPKWISIICRVP